MEQVRTREHQDPRFDLAGEVVCSDIANSRAVHRFVQKRVGQWLAGRLAGAPRPKVYFHVTFTHEGGGHTIGCQARVTIDGVLWKGTHYGDTLSGALSKSLEHMICAADARRVTRIMKAITATTA